MSESSSDLTAEEMAELIAESKALDPSEIRKNNAEATVHEKTAEKLAWEVAITEQMAIGARLAGLRETARWKGEQASDDAHRVFRFYADIKEGTVVRAILQLDEWARLDAELGGDAASRPYTFMINSGGGDVAYGFALHDHLRTIAKAHHITTIAVGTCASMATVVMQAGDTRLSYPSTSWLLHQPAWGTQGRADAHEDMAKYVKLMESRMIDLLAARSPLKASDIRAKVRRTDFWFLADEALRMGLVDELTA